ncbi:hypothetical protein STTU_1713 [Streptomyces sp. Tu6071]|nr:hypothetical protein STTU_1713 [Streptomyces sp. Tu6071]
MGAASPPEDRRSGRGRDVTASGAEERASPPKAHDVREGHFLRAVAFLAVVVRAVLFLAGAFLAVAFFAGAVLAVVFFAVAEVPVAFFAAGAAFLVVAFFAVAVVFFAGAAAVVAFLAAVAFFAVAFFAAALAVVLVPPVRLPLGAFFTATSFFGSFLVPATRSLKPWPARKRGTEVFFTRTRSPVWGLRAYRAGRSTFSNEPNPVTETRSPATVARTMASRTTSTASAAFCRPPSLSAIASTSCALFTSSPSETLPERICSSFFAR